MASGPQRGGMATKTIPVDVELVPDSCPRCGGRRLEAPRPEDVVVEPVDPDAPLNLPGMLECRQCGCVIAWEP